MIQPNQHQHFTDFYCVKKDAFILLNLGYGLNRLSEDKEEFIVSRQETALFRDYGELYENETSSRLIAIAVTARVLDDRLVEAKSSATASKFDHQEEILGDDEEGNPLNLRQCFNKIIHASGIDHELMQLPEIYLSGKTQNEKEWHVRIFLLPFCTAVYQWIDYCQRLQAR
jgi:hypothetical protein